MTQPLNNPILEASPKTLRLRIAREAAKIGQQLNNSSRDAAKLGGALSLLAIASSVAQDNTGEATKLLNLARRLASARDTF